MLQEPPALLQESDIADHYVAYMDILGWSNQIDSDFEATLELYNYLITSVNDARELASSPLTLRIVSDSIFVVSEHLQPVLQASNLLQHDALANDCLLRGGIAFGKHVELADQGNLYVLSKPLVAAARIEESVTYPCISLDPELIKESDYGKLASIPLLTRLVLFYEGLWLVKPFNIMWLQSACSRVLNMRELFPQHSRKYDWFVELYDTFTSGASMLPESVNAPQNNRWAPAHDQLW
jgi:hypothetical protein